MSYTFTGSTLVSLAWLEPFNWAVEQGSEIAQDRLLVERVDYREVYSLPMTMLIARSFRTFLLIFAK